MALNYTKKTLNHFLKPKNIGELKQADARAEIGNMVCGDQLNFSMKVSQGRIKDIKFLSFGCASNIATASIMTEKVKGLTLAQAKKFNWQKIVKDLGGLPQQKVHCSLMAVQGLQALIANYEQNQISQPPLKAKKIKKATKQSNKRPTKKIKK